MPTHCKLVMGLANRMTDAKMVKNLRVVVTMEQVRGPKYTTVMKIKLCKKEERKIHCQARSARINPTRFLLLVTLSV